MARILKSASHRLSVLPQFDASLPIGKFGFDQQSGTNHHRYRETRSRRKSRGSFPVRVQAVGYQPLP